MTRYSEVSYTYSGGSKVFTIPFSYLKTEHINVFIDDVEATDFEFNTTSQIQVNDEITSGQVVKIVRTTPIDSRMVNFNDRSVLNAQQQNLDSNQLFNVVQEVYDRNDNFTVDIQTQVDTANTNASAAVSTANTANSKADTAVSTANTAETKADNAVSTANSASSVANTASINATNAVNTANSASSAATAASNKVDEFGQSIVTVVEAASKINQLEQSVTTATNAATTATNKASEANTSATTASQKVTEITNLITDFNNQKGQINGIAPLDANAKLQLIHIPTGVELTSNKDVANGYCGLDGLGKIPSANIPDLFVQKSGDTMTGTLEFDKSLKGIQKTTNPCMVMNLDHTIDANNLPSSHIYGNGKVMVDNANKQCFREYDRYSTGGVYTHNIQVTNYDTGGTAHSATLAVSVNNAGDTSFSFPMCNAKATTTSSASSSKVAVVTQNYVYGTSWSRVWSDGWIEQGGYLSVTSSSATVNLLKSHANTNYNITLGSYQPTVGAGYAAVISQAKNSFVLDCNGLGSLSMWWRTEGY